MELQLGLAPPIHNQMKGFDLNYHGFEPTPLKGFKLWNYRSFLDSENAEKYVKNKRSFDEAFEDINDDKKPPLLLPLLLWNDEPNEEDDWKEQKKKACNNNINKEVGDENEVVGWPPIKSWRKKQFFNHQVGWIRNARTAVKEGGGGSNSMYVKVNMEGVSIGRKIDLKYYLSYETLLNALIGLFAIYHKGDKDGTNYTLAYQDKEGDWLLAGDVPWKTFIETVQRLEIIRKGAVESANGDADHYT